MVSRTAQNDDHGIGAVAQVSKKFLHPTKLMGDNYPNVRGDHEVSGLFERRREQKNVRRKEPMSIVFGHNDFRNLGLHEVQRWVKVTTPAASLFVTDELTTEGKPDEVAGAGDDYTMFDGTINDAH